MTVRISNMTATFANADIQYDAIGMDATDTASSANSKLINLKVNSTPKFYVTKNGNVVANTISVQTVTTNAATTQTLLVTTATTPASATAAGTQGTIVWDANYIYVCVATNTWKRAALTTWI